MRKGGKETKWKIENVGKAAIDGEKSYSERPFAWRLQTFVIPGNYESLDLKLRSGSPLFVKQVI